MTTCIDEVREWVQTCVLGLNLCPFAHRPFKEGRVHFAAVEGAAWKDVAARLREEWQRLESDAAISNTLLVLNDRRLDYFSFIDLLNDAEDLLVESGYEGVYQLASFHPDYLFGGEEAASRSHFTNRAPWPVLHILRESEVQEAVDTYRDTESIPERNIRTLEQLSEARMRELFGSRFK